MDRESPPTSYGYWNPSDLKVINSYITQMVPNLCIMSDSHQLSQRSSPARLAVLSFVSSQYSGT